MFVFLGSKDKGRTRERLTTVVCLAIVSTVFCVFGTAGCKKRAAAAPSGQAEAPSVLTNRMDDAAYVGALRTNRLEQGAQARERFALAKRQQECRARVQASLPPGADEAALKEALSRDPEWQELDALTARADAGIQATLTDAREAIRRRMAEEARDQRAVAEGRARPAQRDAAKP